MGIKLGIVGTGRIACRAIAEIRETGAFDITAVMNPNGDHAASFASENGIAKAVNDTGALCAKADAIYIASPHGTHYEYAMACLMNGKHVICEKPMAFSKNKAEELFRAAEDNRLVLMEAVKTAYCPGYKLIKEVIASGAIGEVADVEAAFTKLIPEGGREYTDKKFGGAFTEFGTYAMLPVFEFLGTAYDRVAFLSRKAGDVDGYTKAVFEYGDRYACAKTGLTVKSEGQMIISGTKGYLLAPSPWWLTKHFEIRHEDPEQIESYECEFSVDGLRYEIMELADRINGKSMNENSEKAKTVARAEVFERFLKNR